MLADYAVCLEGSRGRRHPEPKHAYRNDFQRDRDRVGHARAFRRLDSKTQVFTRRYSDHFRNRPTHTLEVAQISRTVAAQLGLNVDLVEALALVHDIGHPPFGHAGEKALDTAMREHGYFFDHNLHALIEVREGIIKHSRDYRVEQFPELEEYLLDKKPPLEAQLIDLADEVAYDTADLDDGYEARLLSLEAIRAGVPVFERYYRDVEQIYPDAIEKLKFNEAIKRMLDGMVSDLIRNTGKRIEESRIRSLDDIRNCPHRLASFSSGVEKELREAKKFLFANLYFTPVLEPEKDDAERITRELFNFWMEQPESLPQSYQEKARQEPLFIYDQWEKYCRGK
ncbi:MAG: deoxyguanosinetriphosphate triphosphohydrolase [Acidobacteria bacterium]|nr:MAG: deoxyguanosinetriphosphate triphosphohydrolase [Acidobacteriota bacterium]